MPGVLPAQRAGHRGAKGQFGVTWGIQFCFNCNIAKGQCFHMFLEHKQVFRLGNLKICIWGAFGKYIDSHVPNCTRRKPCEAQLRQEAQVTIVFLQCLGDTCAGYAGQAMYLPNVANIFRPGQALYSSNVWVAPLLDVLGRLSKFCKRKRRNSLGAQGILQVL